MNVNTSGSLARRRPKWAVLAMAIAVLAATLSWGSGAEVSAAAAIPASVTFSTTPALYPAFDPAITDYVVRCTSGPTVQVDVTVPAGWQASINDSRSTSDFGGLVPLTAGQAFSVTALDLNNATGQSYFVRCLPADFPNFTASKPGTPQAEYYVVNPLYPGLTSPATPTITQYVAVVSTDGAPVWWYPINHKTTQAAILPSKDVAWINLGDGTLEEHRMNAIPGTTPVRLIDPQGTAGLDLHELIQLPNGNYLAGINKPRCCYDLTHWGGSASGSVEDTEIVEMRPDGSFAWTWSAAAHINISETGPNWDSTITSLGNQGGRGYDNYHWNSADLSADSTKLLVSFRHLDGVYQIDRATGATDWKIGGVRTNKNLTVLGDTYSPGDAELGGQHDARYWTDGSVTIHDNQMQRNRQARAIRYVIDETLRTATLVDEVKDPLVPGPAFCCGSAKKLPGGNWVIGWGFQQIVTELDNNSNRQFLLQWSDAGFFDYRAGAVLPGVLSRTGLRSDMNSQYPVTP